MRTICPFCNQKYDVGNEWLGQQTACPQCSKEFIIEEAVQCRSCGVYNNAAEKKCRGCQATIFRLNIPGRSQADLPPVKIKPPVKEEKKQLPKRYSAADELEQHEKFLMQMWAAPGALLCFLAIVATVIILKDYGANTISVWGWIGIVFAIIFGSWGVKFIVNLQNRYKKITFNIFERILFCANTLLLWVATIVFFCISGQLSLLQLAQSGETGVWIIGLAAFALIASIYCYKIWIFAKQRAQEDADFTQKELNAIKRNDLRQLRR